VLCTIGDLIEDVVVWLSAEPNLGTDTDSIIQRTRGGSAANVAMFAALTGTESRFIGQVGSDALGQQLCSSLQQAGVDVCVIAEGRTGSIVVLVQTNGERTFLTDRGVASHLSLVDASLMANVGILHVPSYSLVTEPLASTSLLYIKAAQSLGAVISLDASSTSELEHFGVARYKSLIQSIQPQVFLCNEDEAGLLGVGATEGMPGAALTVIKRGAHSTLAISQNNERSEVAVAPVANIVDTTGAGDAFAAGFLPTFVATNDVEVAIARGHAVAARVLRSPGATLDVA
jgi:sugar/nucleoside kinase (ribokinase family)